MGEEIECLAKCTILFNFVVKKCEIFFLKKREKLLAHIKKLRYNHICCDIDSCEA